MWKRTLFAIALAACLNSRPPIALGQMTPEEAQQRLAEREAARKAGETQAANHAAATQPIAQTNNPASRPSGFSDEQWKLAQAIIDEINQRKSKLDDAREKVHQAVLHSNDPSTDPKVKQAKGDLATLQAEQAKAGALLPIPESRVIDLHSGFIGKIKPFLPPRQSGPIYVNPYNPQESDSAMRADLERDESTEVVQINSADEMLVENHYKFAEKYTYTYLLVEETNTAGLTTGRRIPLNGIYIVDGTRNCLTAQGPQTTVFVLRPVDGSNIKVAVDWLMANAQSRPK